MANKYAKNEMDFIIVSVLIVLAVLVAGTSLAVILRPDDVKFVTDKANKCTLIDKVETGERLYCGKACTTPEYKQTFQCADGQTHVVIYYDLHLK